MGDLRRAGAQHGTVEPAIVARELSMVYRATVRPPGLRAAARSLVRRQIREVRAVESLSIEIGPGEVVGFLGPNGAGKTTTLKILAGVLHPTSGSATVAGFTPWRRQYAYLRQIALIRGSRPLDAPIDITVADALRFQALVYEVPDGEYRRNLGVLAEMLSLGPLLSRQLRGLSLGERMRAGLAHALLYRPRVLFLDEPTLGLDVSVTALVRRFLSDYSGETGATILLTSHYMADVESLCRRVVLIDRGVLRYDGSLAALAARLAPFKLLTVAVEEGSGEGLRPDWSAFGDPVEALDGKVSIRVPRDQAAATAARLLAQLPVVDLTVTDPPLEAVMDELYRAGAP